MDDAAFQTWSEQLAELRTSRQEEVKELLQSKGNSSKPADFLKIAQASLEKILDSWFSAEEASWESTPPSDPAAAADASKAELQSIADFEFESIQRDFTDAQSTVSWDPGDVEEIENKFKSLASELKGRYQLKISTLGGAAPRKKQSEVLAEESAKKEKDKPAKVYRSAGGSGSSGTGMALMFVVGLAFGAGPSVYFWDLSKKAGALGEEAKVKAQAEKRSLEDTLTIMRGNLEALAQGKMHSIPAIDKDLARIRDEFARRRQQADKYFQAERERRLKRIPAGDRQDQAIKELETKKAEKLADLSAQESAATEPLMKERNVLTELLSH